MKKFKPKTYTPVRTLTPLQLSFSSEQELIDYISSVRMKQGIMPFKAIWLPDLPGEWWKGGALRESTLAQWNAATIENQIATAADWVHQMDKFSNRTEKLKIRLATGQLEEMKFLSATTELAAAITAASEGKAEAAQMRTAELATMAAYRLGWLADTPSHTPEQQENAVRQVLEGNG